MRTIFKRRALFTAFAAALFTGILPAQDEKPKAGFIRVVNAVAPGTGNAHLKIDGVDLFPKGYKVGQRTGAIGIAPGSKKITVTKEGVEEGTTTLNVTDGETISLIAFGEKLPAKDDKPERWGVKILLLKQRDVASGYRLTVVSVNQEQETLFEIKREGADEKTPNSVKRLMTTTIDLGKNAGDIGVFLRNKEESLVFFRPDSAGNYVVIFYDEPDGSVKAISFYDPKFVIAG